MARRILTNLLVTLASFIFALILAELALRWFPRGGARVEDPHLGSVMTPGGDWDTNGFRNPNALPRADIVVIGDSLTMGWNARREEAWPLVLGSLASSSVYSMALSGYGPVQYAYLANRALLLQPKVLLIGFYLGNDITDAKSMAYGSDAWKGLRDPNYKGSKAKSNELAEFALAAEAGARPGPFSRWIHGVRNGIRSHSRLYVLLGDATRSLRQKIGLAQRLDERQQNIHDFAADHPNLVFVYGKGSRVSTVLTAFYRYDLRNPETQEGWRITQDRLLATQKICANARVPLVILFIPTKERVYLEYMDSRNEPFPDAFSDLEAQEDGTFAALEMFCSRNDIGYTFVLQVMVDAVKRGIQIYDVGMDDHPTAPGYRLIAEHVHRYLIERSLLSSPGTGGAQ